jgi:predicted nucleic acid-binding protein
MSSQLANKHILDTSAWNALFDDEKREDLVKILRRKVILPTSVAITELAAIEASSVGLSVESSSPLASAAIHSPVSLAGRNV